MIRVLWTPEALARTARRLTSLQAELAGAAACVAVLLLPLSASIGTMSEPYRDLSEYVWETVVAAPVAFWLLCTVLGVVGGLAYILLEFPKSTGAAVRTRIILFSPLSIAAPGLVWSVFAALKEYAHPYCGFTGPGGKPAWLESPLVAVLGSSYWLAAGLLLIIVNCKLALRQAARFGDGHCSECGYDLTGNVSGRCPECGASIGKV